MNITWWTFRIFFIFFCSGRGKGESEASGGGGVSIFIENARGGRGSPGGGGGRGAGRVSAVNWGIWGGGTKYFFRGRNVHQDHKKKTWGELISLSYPCQW